MRNSPWQPSPGLTPTIRYFFAYGSVRPISNFPSFASVPAGTMQTGDRITCSPASVRGKRNLRLTEPAGDLSILLCSIHNSECIDRTARLTGLKVCLVDEHTYRIGHGFAFLSHGTEYRAAFLIRDTACSRSPEMIVSVLPLCEYSVVETSNVPSNRFRSARYALAKQRAASWRTDSDTGGFPKVVNSD